MVFPSIPSAYYNLDPSNGQHHQQVQQNRPTLHHGSSSSNNSNPLLPPPLPGGPGPKIRPTGTMAERALLENASTPKAGLRCPRCGSTNTKFCYYNNYSFSQPRYFCRSCRRKWTHGGTLRTIPIGGASRSNKRSKPSSSSGAARSSSATSAVPISTNYYYNNYSDDGMGFQLGGMVDGSVGAEQWRMIQPSQFPFPGGFGTSAGEGASTSFYGQVPFEDAQIILQGAAQLDNNEFGNAV